MKDFFKYTLATMTGIIVTCIILFFITSAVVVSLVSFADKQEVDVFLQLRSKCFPAINRYMHWFLYHDGRNMM